MAVRWRRTLGLTRSLITYRHPGRQRGLRQLYAPFIKADDLVFDVGAHLGDRTRAFAALGAQVVAFEPQPHLMAWLQRLEGRQTRVSLRPEAVGAEPGSARLAVSLANPTVSTMAASWRQGIGAANSTFKKVRWEQEVEVAVVTLDQMIAEYGLPAFCKIDVEGFEEDVLRGVSQPLPALSFEFVTGTLERSVACIQRLEALAPGRYRYNAVPGEQRRFLFPQWQTADQLQGWLERGAGEISSGDIYARL